MQLAKHITQPLLGSHAHRVVGTAQIGHSHAHTGGLACGALGKGEQVIVEVGLALRGVVHGAAHVYVVCFEQWCGGFEASGGVVVASGHHHLQARHGECGTQQEVVEQFLGRCRGVWRVEHVARNE